MIPLKDDAPRIGTPFINYLLIVLNIFVFLLSLDWRYLPPEPRPEFSVPSLDALVRMKLTSFHLKDKLHLLDLLEVGLIDEGACERFPPELAARLRELIDSRERET